ncbi:ruvb-like [Anaeramoeba flamelloides]|uniref:RuvB-like helicase n=1 Tax=Anaeramoeba flamelloides TaxID=1746091 RepID=A0AAV7YU55_9EUKA|nr:ruvb-like [Anaeramoeba flamelloides]
MDSIYEIGNKMIDQLSELGISSGDVISIQKAGGKVTKFWRSYSRSKDYDILTSNINFIECPSGELQKTNEVVHMISLHDMDVINSNSRGFEKLFLGNTGEIKQKICEKINETLEDDLSPILIMDSNRGITPICKEDIKHILKIRAEEEDVEIDEEALEMLTYIGIETSLRYAIQLIITSDLVSKKRKGTKVKLNDVRRVYSLFADFKRSSQFLKVYQKQFMFFDKNEIEEENKIKIETKF